MRLDQAIFSVPLASGSQLVILPHRGHLAVSGDIFGYCIWRGGPTAGIQWVGAEGAANILQCTGPPAQQVVQAEMSEVSGLKNPA